MTDTLQAHTAGILREQLSSVMREIPEVAKQHMKKGEEGSSAPMNQAPEIALSDTYTAHDYEVILDFLYGLYNEDDAIKVRVFDPFVSDTKCTPWVTPRMLTERIESLLDQTRMREAA